ELAENDLLRELELHINFSTGENKKLVGLFGINEKKLQELSEAKVLDFHKRGLFIPIHAMLGSIGQINRLAQLRNLSDSEQKVTAIQIQFAKETAEA
ncbi:SapC family protein, partial [Colwellia sp. BRX8-8]|nr:SapC family protein [Colwellia sp. BRX8-8]